MGQAKLRKEQIDLLKKQSKIPNKISFMDMPLTGITVFTEIDKIINLTKDKVDYNTAMIESDFDTVFNTKGPWVAEDAGFFMCFVDRQDGPVEQNNVKFGDMTYKCLNLPQYPQFSILCSYCTPNFAWKHYKNCEQFRNVAIVAFSNLMQCQVIAEFPVR